MDCKQEEGAIKTQEGKELAGREVRTAQMAKK